MKSAVNGSRYPTQSSAMRLPIANPGCKKLAQDNFLRHGRRPAKSSVHSKRTATHMGRRWGHTFGDAPTFTYTMLWAFGGAETDKSGKKVVLNSKGALESVKFMQAYWKECCDEGGLAWDDTNNNRAFHAGDISASLNGASIYLVAKRQKDKIKDDKGEPMWQDIDHAPLPAGPSGACLLFLNHSDAIMKYSRNQKLAKDFLR
jgi:multiple sugar transport system substrate-binding protein